jgi:lipase chaperone LimK
MREDVLFMLSCSFTGAVIRTQRRMLQCSMLAKDGECVDTSTVIRDGAVGVQASHAIQGVDRRRATWGQRSTNEWRVMPVSCCGLGN